MQPLAVRTLPRPALKQMSSSSTRTAASTASIAPSRFSSIAAPAASAASSPAARALFLLGIEGAGRIEPAPPWTTSRHLVSLMAGALAASFRRRQLTFQIVAYYYDIN